MRGFALTAVLVALAVLAAGCGSSKRATDPRCVKPGIHYTGTTPGGVAICFTLATDGLSFPELQFRPAGECPKRSTAPVPSPGAVVLTNALAFPGVTVAIDGASASGVIQQPKFCGGRRIAWTARTTQAVPTLALANLRRAALAPCAQQGTHYIGRTAQLARLCLTVGAGGDSLIESGWAFAPASGCPAAALGGMTSTDNVFPVDAAGAFQTDVIRGTIRGATASGVLSDEEYCPGKTFRWTARRMR